MGGAVDAEIPDDGAELAEHGLPALRGLDVLALLEECSPRLAMFRRWSVTFSSPSWTRPGAETTTTRRSGSSDTISRIFSIWLASATELPPNLQTMADLIQSLPNFTC